MRHHLQQTTSGSVSKVLKNRGPPELRPSFRPVVRAYSPCYRRCRRSRLMPRQVFSLNSDARVPPTLHRSSSRLDLRRYESPSPKSAIFNTARIAAEIKSGVVSPKATSALSISESNPLHSYSSKLFVVAKNINSFGIKQIQTLSPKHPGWGTLSRCALPQQAKLLTLCFHGLTNCFSRNLFFLINICVAPGGGVCHHKIAPAA